jgi:tetratricopeptide (TPR) repeat protein
MKSNALNRRHQAKFWHQSSKAKISKSSPYPMCPLRLLPTTNQPLSNREIRVKVSEKANQGDYIGAIALLNELLERQPESATDYNNRGLMYFRNSQLSEALKDYNHALELNSRLDSAYNNRANCHVALGNLAEAITDYENALDYNPGNLRAWINQGITFRELGLHDLAIENFDLALILGGRLQGRIYAERGYTYHLRGDWNCAIADYHRALTHLPSTGSMKCYKQQVEMWLNQLLNPLSA